MTARIAASNDTIVAPATGAGLAAIAVIRMSGPATRDLLEAICGGVPPARHAALRDIGPPQRALIDRGLVLWFPAPASFTGEDMAELHVHGGRAVMRAVVDALLSLPGTRLAEPGEFARRAFENGKLDLTEVEGLADLITAETEAQRRQALAQSQGSLRALYEGWRDELLRAQALIEAGLDFADEGDVIADVGLKAETIAESLARRDRAPSRRPQRRALARRAARGDRRSAQCRQVVAAECARQARRGDRVGGGRHHARCHRGASRSRRRAGHADRHRRSARGGRRGRGRGDKTGIGAGRGRRSGVVAGRCHRAAMGPAWRAICAQIRANIRKARANRRIEQDRSGAGRRRGQGGCQSLGQDRRGHRRLWSRPLAEPRGACHRDRGRGAAADPDPPPRRTGGRFSRARALRRRRS